MNSRDSGLPNGLADKYQHLQVTHVSATPSQYPEGKLMEEKLRWQKSWAEKKRHEYEVCLAHTPGLYMITRAEEAVETTGRPALTYQPCLTHHWS